MSQKYTVSAQNTLLPFLFSTLEGWSKNTIKQRLRGGAILVNSQVQTQHNFTLQKGDIIEVGSIQHSKSHANQKPAKLEILYQDQDLIAINKPAGLLSVATAKENKQHALALLRTQISRTKKGLRLWPVHRLDRETSGILLFATSKEIREAVMSHWEENKKSYLAIVEGLPSPEAGSITEPLRLDSEQYRMHVGAHPDAKAAITHYRLKENNSTHALLEVTIETGRQHQIRAHMAWLGHSVIGDERYGTKGTRMALHASHLTFMHPTLKESIRLDVDAPRDFYALL